MREIRVSSTLTVYHDGQFWVGTFERIENGITMESTTKDSAVWELMYFGKAGADRK